MASSRYCSQVAHVRDIISFYYYHNHTNQAIKRTCGTRTRRCLNHLHCAAKPIRVSHYAVLRNQFVYMLLCYHRYSIDICCFGYITIFCFVYRVPTTSIVFISLEKIRCFYYIFVSISLSYMDNLELSCSSYMVSLMFSNYHLCCCFFMLIVSIISYCS